MPAERAPTDSKSPGAGAAGRSETSGERPLIVVSNDDGIESPFIEPLAQGLASTGAEVLVVAPERQRSAMSHTITLHKPVRVIERAPGRISVSGTPVDCVYIAVVKLATRRPALVVSGINDGYNLGTDVFYSGTVGAAVEAGLRGIPAMAVSLAPKAESELETAVALATRFARTLLEAPPPPGIVLNLNVPKGSGGRFRYTRLGKRFYEDDVHERQDPRGRSYYWIGGGIAGVDETDGCDTAAIYKHGVCSVSPLHLDITSHKLLDGAGDWPLPDLPDSGPR